MRMDPDILQSTLDDLSHLIIPPERLTLEDDVELGVGGYGEVFLAVLRISDLQIKVAVKQLIIVQPKGVRRHLAVRLVRELKIWATAKHPNILELLGFYLDDNYGCAQLVSAYMANGNVKEYIDRLQPNLATRLRFVQGITSGMSYLHNCNPAICHGDLKPTNVLVNESLDAVLCDFGLARFIMESGVSSGLTTTKSVKGATRYLAPELLLDGEAKHTLKSDVWAWACTTFEVLTGHEPFSNAKREEAVVTAIVMGRSPGSVDLLDSLVSDGNITYYLTFESLKSIFPDCWIGDSAKRPSSSEILNRLISPDGIEATRVQKGYGEGATLMNGHESAVRICQWNPRKRDVLATGSADGKVRLWTVPVPPAALLDPVTINHHPGSEDDCSIWAMEWDCTGARLATGCRHGALRVWTAEGALQSDLKLHTDGISRITWSPGALFLLSASHDGTVVVWDMRTQKRDKIYQVFRFHSDIVSYYDSLWFDDETLISSGRDGQIHIRRLHNETPLCKFTGHENGVRFLRLSKDKTLLASSSYDLTIRVWNMNAVEAGALVQSPTGQTEAAQKWVLRGHTGALASLGWCPSLNPVMQYLLVSTSFDGTSRVWDARNGSCIKELLDPRDKLCAQSFSPRGRYLATRSRDSRVLIHSLTTGTLLFEWDCQSGHVSDIQWQSAGDQLAVCLEDGGVVVLDTNKVGFGDWVAPRSLQF